MQYRSDIEQGFTVFGSDGKKIGTVKECTETYCHMDTGFLGLGPDYYFPKDSVQDVRGNEVILNVPSNQIGQLGWDREPTGPVGPTYGGTMPGGRGYAPGEMPERGYGREERAMPLREEELTVQREREQAGEVTIGKHVEEEQRTIHAPVSHEEVYVKEHQVDRPSTEPIGEGETIRIPVSEERVTIEKEPHVYGEIEVEKRRVTEEKPFTETVRKEVPDVSGTGKAREHIKTEMEAEEKKAEKETEEEREARRRREQRR